MGWIGWLLVGLGLIILFNIVLLVLITAGYSDMDGLQSQIARF